MGQPAGLQPTAALPLDEPRDGVPQLVDTAAALTAAAGRLAAGHGPVAVDAERASGYRYTPRAYLVQLRRAGAGTVLLDPVAVPRLDPVARAIADTEWVLHAAGQDLPCLAELGLRPQRLFDTELAGRLAGHQRVGLGPLVESVLGYRLEKGHSAADWSRRPLPDPLLRYAALDVELLVELRDALAAELAGQGKLGWAEQEFAALCRVGPPPTRADRWRRTSGIHRVRGRRRLAALRAVWEVRDRMARDRDLAPGRVIPDAALVDAVLAAPASAEALARLPVWRGRRTRRFAAEYFTALHAASRLPEEALPAAQSTADGPPPAGRWADRDPVAARRLARARHVLAEVATAHGLPAENLLAPDLVRRLAWSPPDPPTPATVADRLATGGARPWQVQLAADPLATALPDPGRPAPG